MTLRLFYGECFIFVHTKFTFRIYHIISQKLYS